MSNAIKILAFAGSTRKDSFNKKLLALAMKSLSKYNADVSTLDLRELPMPIYDGDLEIQSGIPENAVIFRHKLRENQGFLICSPEYNSSVSGVLKNAIDWASRPVNEEPYLACFVGKIVRLMSASIGQWGGTRGLTSLRSIFGNIGSVVLPEQLSIPFAEKAFTPGGELVDDLHKQLMDKMCQDLVNFTQKVSK